MRLRSSKNIANIHERLQKLLGARRVFWVVERGHKILKIGEYYYVEDFIFYSVRNGLLYMHIEFENLALNITKTGQFLHFEDTYKKTTIESLRIHETIATETAWIYNSYHVSHKPHNTYNTIDIYKKGFAFGFGVQRKIVYNKR